MLTTSDLITLPYTQDLTQGGIAYTCRSLPYLSNSQIVPSYSTLRQNVSDKAIDIAFLRYLASENIPHQFINTTPFTNSDHLDIALGRRRCELVSLMITRKNYIHRIHDQLDTLLNIQVLLPIEELKADFARDEDLYVFVFLTGLITKNRKNMDLALNANQPVYLIHLCPIEWALPSHWIPLSPLVFESDISNQVHITLGGLDSNRRFQAEQLLLNPCQSTVGSKEFYTLNYLHISSPPGGSVGITSSAIDSTYLIKPHQWGNIWVYGMKIILAGYVTHAKFSKQANTIPIGSNIFPYQQTCTENLAMPMNNLWPLEDLFTRTKIWSQRD